MSKSNGKPPPAITPTERLSTLKTLWAVLARYSYQKVADKLGYSYAYVHQIANNKLPPGKPFDKAIKKLYHDILVKENNRKPPPKRVSVTFPGEPELADDIKAEFSQEEFRAILKKEYFARHPESDLPPFMAKNERYFKSTSK